MQVMETALAGVLLLEPRVFHDARGSFVETWQREKYVRAGVCADFVQDNLSLSRHGVVRGLHFQLAPYAQAKLIWSIQGTILDVVVDLRPGSATFGRHVSVELSGDNRRQLFVPRGLAHGFAVLSAEAALAYKCDNVYMPAYERGIAADDPELGIDWRIPVAQRIVSEQDSCHPTLRAFMAAEGR